MSWQDKLLQMKQEVSKRYGSPQGADTAGAGQGMMNSVRGAYQGAGAAAGSQGALNPIKSAVTRMPGGGLGNQLYKPGTGSFQNLPNYAMGTPQVTKYGSTGGAGNVTAPAPENQGKSTGQSVYTPPVGGNGVANANPTNQNPAGGGQNGGEGYGIRNILTGQYGLDNSRIGYEDGWVTYNGQKLVQPDYVDEEAGVSYVSDPKKLYGAVANLNADGQTAARGALNEMGISDERIGYNEKGQVTVDGRPVIDADREENGIAYVDDRSDVTNGVIQAYRNQGVNVVNGSQYAANSAYPLSISADGKTASVAGQTVEPLFIENGVAYFDSADIDRAIGAAKQQSGIQSRQEILNEQQAKYDPYYDHLLDQMVYRDEFDYDPNEDIVFQSYKDQYGREGDRAMRNAIGSMSGLTGGYANSAAVTAGAQQRQYWGDQLMDRIPELAAQAYERYVGDFDMDNQALNSVMGLDDMTFERAYGVNNDLINDVRYNNEANEARLKDARDWDYKVGRDKVSDAQWEKNHEQEVLNNQVDRTYTEASTGNVKADTEKAKAETEAINQQIKIDEINSVWDQALKRGSWGKPGSPEYNTAKELGFDIEQTPYYYYDHINEIYKIN